MKRAAALGIFALGLTGLLAIACAPTYGEAEPAPASSENDSTSVEQNQADPPKPKPAGKVTGGGTVSGDLDGGSAPPKTPGATTGTDAGNAAQLDGGACAKKPAASGYTIKDSTPQQIGACSTADIGYYEGLLAVKDQTFGGLEKAMTDRNPLCAGCVFSKYEDATWTPVVMLSADGGFYNWGSCYANSPGGTPECAKQVQQWFSCLDDACGDCLTDEEYDACNDKAAADPTQCGALKFDACTNLDALNAACDSIGKAIAVSCGP